MLGFRVVGFKSGVGLQVWRSGVRGLRFQGLCFQGVRVQGLRFEGFEA